MTATRGTRAGEVLDDRYRILTLLGAGGMGEVYEAKHVKLGRRYAIKFLLAELAANRDALQRFFTEAEAAGRLTHGNIAAALDMGVAPDGSPYLVLEFLDGCDAQALIDRDGPLSVERAADVVSQAARGLAFAHADGIIHRDLKPANLFVTLGHDGTDHVKVLDFGIAKLAADATGRGTGGTQAGTMLGTASYMSPEQISEGAGEVDARTDVYSLGVVLYQLLTGALPHRAETIASLLYKIVSSPPAPIAELRPTLPPGVVQIVERALAKHRADRFASMAEFAVALEPFLPSQRRAGPASQATVGLFVAASASTPPSPRSAAETAPIALLATVQLGATDAGVFSSRSHAIAGIGRSRARVGVALGLGLVALLAALSLFLVLRSPPAQATRAAATLVEPRAPAPTFIPAAEATAEPSAPPAASDVPSASPATSAPSEPLAKRGAGRPAPTTLKASSPWMAPLPTRPAAAPTAAPPGATRPTLDSVTDDRK